MGLIFNLFFFSVLPEDMVRLKTAVQLPISSPCCLYLMNQFVFNRRHVFLGSFLCINLHFNVMSFNSSVEEMEMLHFQCNSG